MLELHARTGAEEDLGARFGACFVRAADDAGLPDDPEFRTGLRAYMEWAVGEVLSYSPPESHVAPDLPVSAGVGTDCGRSRWIGLRGRAPGVGLEPTTYGLTVSISPLREHRES